MLHVSHRMFFVEFYSKKCRLAFPAVAAAFSVVWPEQIKEPVAVLFRHCREDGMKRVWWVNWSDASSC